jgi:hypothetical protein
MTFQFFPIHFGQLSTQLVPTIDPVRVVDCSLCLGALNDKTLGFIKTKL